MNTMMKKKKKWRRIRTEKARKMKSHISINENKLLSFSVCGFVFRTQNDGLAFFCATDKTKQQQQKMAEERHEIIA